MATRSTISDVEAPRRDADQEGFTNGFQVVDSGGDLGKVAFATRDFRPLDIVLVEAPALIFDYENQCFGLFDAFLDASSEVQSGILEMHHVDTSAQPNEVELDRKERDEIVESEVQRYNHERQNSKLTVELAQTLVRIVGNNAHSFDDPGGSADVEEFEKSALFLIGSKAEHSCAPNLVFSTNEGMLRFVAEIPISRGERLSTSYAQSILQTCRQERREFLQQHKAFTCQCSRCLGLDECRPMPCHKCHDGVMFLSGDTEKWCCVSLCGWHDQTPTLQSSDSELAKDIGFFRDSLEHGMDESMLPTVMAAQARVVQTCHPLHWLHIAAWDLVSIVASSLARALADDKSNTVASLLLLSATCQLHQVLWTERNAAIVYGRLELNDAVNSVSKNGLRVDYPEDANEISRLLDLLSCRPPARPAHYDCTEVTQNIFHACQDQLLAGHAGLAAKLYGAYESMLLRGTISAKNKANVRVLVESGGKENNFENELL